MLSEARLFLARGVETPLPGKVSQVRSAQRAQPGTVITKSRGPSSRGKNGRSLRVTRRTDFFRSL